MIFDEIKKLLKTYESEISFIKRNDLGHKGLSSEIKTGIPPKKIEPTPFLTPKRLIKKIPFWRSLATRSKMDERLNNYINSKAKFCTDEIACNSRRIVEEAILKFVPVDSVKPFSYAHVFREVPQDTSPGFPYTRIGIYEKRDCKMVFSRLNFISKNLFAKNLNLSPCVSQARLQLCKVGENKPRLIWAYPMEVTMMEGVYALPLINALRNLPFFAWNYNWLDGYCQIYWDKMVQGRGAKFGGDWSRFDAENHSEAIQWAFDLLKKLIHFKDSRDKRRWRLICDYFIETPILHYGRLYLILGGVPSGSFFTQIIDSLLNMYYSCDIFSRLYKSKGLGLPNSIDDLFSYSVFLGDDSSLATNVMCGHYDRAYLSELALNVHGKELHPEKGFWYHMPLVCDEGDYNFEFLGKTISSRLAITVDPALVLAQLAYPEKADTDPGDALTRCIGVLWMAGVDEKCDALCRMFWEHVKTKFPDSKPTPYKKNLRDIFQFMLFIKEPPLELPSRADVVGRYLCR